MSVQTVECVCVSVSAINSSGAALFCARWPHAGGGEIAVPEDGQFPGNTRSGWRGEYKIIDEGKKLQ